MASDAEPSEIPPPPDALCPRAAATLLLEAQERLRSGDYERALESLTAASAIQPAAPGLADLREKAIILSRLGAAHVQKLGGRPNLATPKTYNERILHRIVYDRSPILKTLCDKVAVRGFIRERVGDAFNVPLIGVWDRAESVDWASLPQRFVIKSSHATGQYRVVTDRSACDPVAVLKEAANWLSHDFGRASMEWGYLGLPRRVIVEPLQESPDGGPLIEVQAHVFSGRVGLFRLWTGAKKTLDRRGAWYTRELRSLKIETGDVRLGDLRLDAATRDAVIGASETVAAGISYLRVDFYLTHEGLRIGELTPYVGAGRTRFFPPERDAQLGRLWDGDFDLLDIPSVE